jgi:hypothetical protein
MQKSVTFRIGKDKWIFLDRDFFYFNPFLKQILNLTLKIYIFKTNPFGRATMHGASF